MLNAFKVTKRFGALTALDDLSFEVKKGQVFGIVRPNGAGKSTVFNLIETDLQVIMAHSEGQFESN